MDISRADASRSRTRASRCEFHACCLTYSRNMVCGQPTTHVYLCAPGSSVGPPDGIVVVRHLLVSGGGLCILLCGIDLALFAATAAHRCQLSRLARRRTPDRTAVRQSALCRACSMAADVLFSMSSHGPKSSLVRVTHHDPISWCRREASGLHATVILQYRLGSCYFALAFEELPPSRWSP